MSLLREKYVVITRKICRYNEKRSRYNQKRSHYNDIIEWKKYYVDGSITSPYIWEKLMPMLENLCKVSGIIFHKVRHLLKH